MNQRRIDACFSHFPSIREEKSVLLDKTKLIYELVNTVIFAWQGMTISKPNIERLREFMMLCLKAKIRYIFLYFSCMVVPEKP